MAKLKKRITLRIPDRAAIAVALVLVVTAVGGTLNDLPDNPAFGPQNGAPGIEMPVMLKKIEPDPTSDDAGGKAKPLAARFLLLRHG